MRAAIYARKSTEQENVPEAHRSVDRQVANARAFAEKQGWTVADECIYVDDGISGAEFKRRPGYRKLMNALEQPPFDVVVMSEESRLGREQMRVGAALMDIVDSGTRVFCYLNRDPEVKMETSKDKLMVALQASKDEDERVRAQQRVRETFIRKVKAGHAVFGKSFGYRNEPVLDATGQRTHSKHVVYEPEAVVVRQIFQWCASGIGRRGIARKLTEMGVVATRNRKQKGGWQSGTVRQLLTREIYRGVRVYNATVKGKRSTTQIARPTHEHIRIEMPELRIVTDELWTAAHEQLAKSQAVYGPSRVNNGKRGEVVGGAYSPHFLVGIAQCRCGGKIELCTQTWLHGKRGTLQNYRCGTRTRQGKAACSSPETVNVPLEVANTAVVDMLGTILTPERLTRVVEEAIARADEQRHSTDMREAVEAQLADVTRTLANLTDAVIRGGTIETLVERMKVEEARKRHLDQQLAALNRQPVVFDKALKTRITKAVAEWRTILADHRNGKGARAMAVNLLSSKITVAKERDAQGVWGYRFTATGTMGNLLTTLVSLGNSVSQTVTSPQPCDRMQIELTHWVAA